MFAAQQPLEQVLPGQQICPVPPQVLGGATEPPEALAPAPPAVTPARGTEPPIPALSELLGTDLLPASVEPPTPPFSLLSTTDCPPSMVVLPAELPVAPPL